MSLHLFQLLILSVFIATFVNTTSSCAPYGDTNRIRTADPVSRPMLVGGWSQVDVSDPDVQMMAAFATLALLKKDSNLGESLFKLSSVKSAERQVVSGVNYKLRLALKGENKEDQICDVIVYDQPWTKTREVTSYRCHQE